MDTNPSPIRVFPEDVLSEALEEDSVDRLRQALELARSLYTEESGDGSYSSFIYTVICDVVGRPSLPLLAYLLDVEQVPVSQIGAAMVSANPSRSLIEALVARGWDVNTAEPKKGIYRGNRLLDYLVGHCHDEELARWLIEEMGARIDAADDDGGDGDDPEYVESPAPIPILENCSKWGSVALFNFLRDHGARLNRRLLHQAVLSAALRGANPGHVGDIGDVGDVGGPDGEKKRNSAEMLRFLVDKVGLDVNALDSERDHRLNQWGTPVCYAATAKAGANVVKWLLEKGADPTVKGPYTGFDAWGLAKLKHCDEVLKVLDDWKSSKEGGC